MPFHIRDEAADRAVRALAARTDQSLTGAVRQAAEKELRRMETAGRPLSQRIAVIQQRARALPPTGAAADKAFYDELSGDA